MSSLITKETDELKKLIAENPDLPIVVLAGSDANDGERCYLEHCRSSLATQTSTTDAGQHRFDAKAASTKMCNLA